MRLPASAMRPRDYEDIGIVLVSAAIALTVVLIVWSMMEVV